MKPINADIFVIGGSAAGMVAAVTAKSKHPQKKVVLVRQEKKPMVPCGIPYIFGTLESSNNNVMPDTALDKAGVDVLIDTVVSVDHASKSASLKTGTDIHFEKLIMATGSMPVKPKWLEGGDLDNVFTIPKNKDYLDSAQNALKTMKKVIVVGAGFIGVEMSDELKKSGVEVTLVEIQDRILGLAFDREFAEDAREVLERDGVNVMTGVGIKAVKGDGKVQSVELTDGQSLDADAVVLSMGYAPNTKLAKAMGLVLNDQGFIKVDAYMRTNLEDVYAAGDCAEKHDFATGRVSTTMLASTACAEARVAGLNLYSISTFKAFKGTIGIYSTKVGQSAYGVAGLTEESARKAGFNVVTGSFTGMDRHPGTLKDAHKQTVKLIVSRDCGTILGGEVIGGLGTGEMTNVLGVIIQTASNVNDILTMQIGTQPMLTASPAKYPLIKAAEVASRNMDGCCAPDGTC